MLNAIINYSIKNRMVVLLGTFLLIGAGIFSLLHIPIDAVPDITNNQVQIITTSPSLAPQEVERFITYPIEQTMTTIPQIEEMRSISRFGLSVVTIVFDDDVDIFWARQQISERLVQAKESNGQFGVSGQENSYDVSIYFPYSSEFDISASGDSYGPVSSLVAASAEADEALGYQPYYSGGVLVN